VERLLFFTDGEGFVPARMLDGLIAAMRGRDFELVGVCTRNAALERPAWRRRLREGVRAALLARLSPETRIGYRPPPPLAPADRGLPIFMPPANDYNDPAFIDRLAREVRPTVGFSCYCLQRWKPALIDLFDQAVNYHNGLLPSHRGLCATPRSVYAGEPESGFSYHRMTPGLDEGPILVEGCVPVWPGVRSDRIEWDKVDAATRCLPRLLDLLSRRSPGRPQEGEADYFSKRDARAIQRIDEPQRLTSGELQRRMFAWRRLELRFEHRVFPVTRLEPARIGEPLAFCAADGAVLRPTRFEHLPRSLWELRRRMLGTDSD
jgi:methionyl-tRNA formyltransferase